MSAPIVHVHGGVVAIPRTLVTDDESHAAWLALSAPNPARAAAERGGDPQAYRHPDRASSLVVDGEVILVPIAAASVYRRLLDDKTYELLDDRPRYAAEPRVYRGELLDCQRDAVDALAARTCGCLEAPCGAGKGEIIVALVGRLGLPTLVIAPTIDTARDLRSRLARRLDIVVGMVGGGMREVERVTVAVAASLDAATVAELAPHYEVVVCDESHHAAATGLRAALRGLRARRWYGCTATPRRADGLEAFVAHHLGPIVHRVSRADLVAAGRSVEPTYVEVASTFAFAYRSREDWPALLDALEQDVDRDRLIVDLVVRACAGELSAVIVGRVDHADRLAEALRERGLRAESLTGRRAKRDRARIIDAACAGELDVVVGTSLMDEGINLPRLSRVVLAVAARAEGRLVQRVGRCLRVHASKAPPVVYDIVDTHVGLLRHQARQRRAVIERVFGGGDVAAATEAA